MSPLSRSSASIIFSSVTCSELRGTRKIIAAAQASDSISIAIFIGNGVACIVVSRWENELDMEALRRELSGGT